MNENLNKATTVTAEMAPRIVNVVRSYCAKLISLTLQGKKESSENVDDLNNNVAVLIAEAIAAAQSSEGKWIAVKDRLPPLDVPLFFTVEGTRGWLPYAGMAKTINSDEKSVLTHYNGSFTHWMPLPQPPTGVK